MKWFRMYTEVRNDAKLRSLTIEQRWVWLSLLCYAAEQGEERGTIANYDEELLAIEVADGDAALLTATLARLEKLRIIRISEGTLIFIHFLERQYDKPSDKPERVAARVKAYRERRTSTGNADVTPRNAMQRAYSDTDTEDNTIPTGSSSTQQDLSGRSRRPDSKPKVSDAPAPTRSEKPSSQPADSPPMSPAPPTPHPKVNPLWDALVEVLEYEPTTKTERSNWGRVVKSLKEAHATADDVHIRTDRYVRKYGRDMLTINAIEAHWSALANEPSVATGTDGPQILTSRYPRVVPQEPRPMPISRGQPLNAKPKPLVPLIPAESG